MYRNVFISYAREDQAFINQVNDLLDLEQRQTWIDWKDIPEGEPWKQRIYEGIEQADNFVFVVSPHSLRSRVCQEELEYALTLNKRIIPVIRREPRRENIPEEISSLQYIFLRDEEELHSGVIKLINTIDKDYDWIREHTRLTVKASEWSRAGQHPSYLLHGQNLKSAQAWLTKQEDNEPAPSQLILDFIDHSRRRSSNQKKMMVVLSTSIITVIALLYLLYFRESKASLQKSQQLSEEIIQKQTAQVLAEEQKSIADFESDKVRSKELFLQASDLLYDFPLRSILLGVESLKMLSGYQDPPVNGAYQTMIDDLSTISGIGLPNENVDPDLLIPEISQVLFSPDGNLLASFDVHQDEPILVFDISENPRPQLSYAEKDFVGFTDHSGWILAKNGQEYFLKDVTDGSTQFIGAFSFSNHILSPDGSTLFGLNPDNTITILSLHPPEFPQVTIQPLITDVQYMLGNPQGQQLLLASDTAMEVISLADSSSVKMLEMETLSGFSFSPDGSLIAICKDNNQVQLLDTADFTILKTLDLGNYTCKTVKVSPDKNWLAISMSPLRLRLMNISSLDIPLKGLDLHCLEDFDFSNNSNWLYISHVSPMGSFIGPRSVEILRLSGLADLIEENETNKLILDASVDDIDLSNQFVEFVGHEGEPFHATFHPTRSILASVDTYPGGSVRLWNLEPYEQSITEFYRNGFLFENKITHISTDKESTLIVIPNKDEIHFWDTSDFSALGNQPKYSLNVDNITDLRFSKDAKRYLQVQNDKIIQVYDSKKIDSSPYYEVKSDCDLFDYDISAEQDIIVTICEDGQVTVWQKDNQIRSYSISPDVIEYKKDLSFSYSEQSPLFYYLEDGNRLLIQTALDEISVIDIFGKGDTTSYQLDESIREITISSDMRYIAVDMKYGAVYLFWINPYTGAFQFISQLTSSIYAFEEIIMQSFFSEDGQLLVIHNPLWEEYPPIIWKMIDFTKETTDKTIYPITFKTISNEMPTILTARLSSNNRWLAVPYGYKLYLYDIQNPYDQAQIFTTDSMGRITQMDFSTDGKWLAFNSDYFMEKKIFIVDLENLNQKVIEIPLPEVTTVYLFHFINENWLELIYTKDYDKFKAIFSLDLKEIVELGCKVAGRNLNESEWEQYFPNQDYRWICDPPHDYFPD